MQRRSKQVETEEKYAMSGEGDCWTSEEKVKAEKPKSKEERRLRREMRAKTKERQEQELKNPGILARAKQKIALIFAKIARLAGQSKVEKKMIKIGDPMKAMQEEQEQQAALRARKGALKAQKLKQQKKHAVTTQDDQMANNLIYENSDFANLRTNSARVQKQRTSSLNERREMNRGSRFFPGKLSGDLADFADFLRESEIALVPMWYLSELVNATQPPPRRQDLRSDALKMISHWSELVNVRIISVSHAWLTKEHPDPNGTQIKQIVDVLKSHWLNPDDLIFYDWCSMYQHDPTSHQPRTKEEQWCFDRALKGMELLFTHHNVEVLVIHDSTGGKPYSEDEAGDGVCAQYFERGWCYFELVVANYFHKVLNAADENVGSLMGMMRILEDDPRKMCGVFKNKKFRNPSDKVIVSQMMERIFEVGVEGELRTAAESGNYEKVIELLTLGADPNAADSHGRTPLHRAAMVPTIPEDIIQIGAYNDPPVGKRANIARALLVAKANPEAQARCGYTPLELARICGQVEVATILQDPHTWAELLD